MPTNTLLTVELTREHDVVLARQRARQLAAEFKLDSQDQIRFATAVSEIARNAHQYAGGGKVEFQIDAGPPAMLVARIADRGPGIRAAQDVLGRPLRVVDRTRSRHHGRAPAVRHVLRRVRRLTSGPRSIVGKRLPRRMRVTPATINAAMGAVACRAGSIRRSSCSSRTTSCFACSRSSATSRRKATVSRRSSAETNRGVLALYAELDERAVYLERVNELKTRFLSDLNHEIRTPLNAVRNVARLLLDGYEGPLTDRHRRAIEMMRHSTDSLSDLVNDWLDLAKIEAGRTDVHVDTFTVEALWGALRGVFRPIETDEVGVARLRAAAPASAASHRRIEGRADPPQLHLERARSSPSAARCACRRARGRRHDRVLGRRHRNRDRRRSTSSACSRSSRRSRIRCSVA